LAQIFATRTRMEWVDLFIEHDVAGAPVYRAGETHADPHFAARSLWTDGNVHGVDLLASPVRIDGHVQTAAAPAPSAGSDTAEVLATVLGYDADRIDELVAAGTVTVGGDAPERER